MDPENLEVSGPPWGWHTVGAGTLRHQGQCLAILGFDWHPSKVAKTSARGGYQAPAGRKSFTVDTLAPQGCL